MRQQWHGPVNRVTAGVEKQLRAQLQARADLTLEELRQQLRQEAGAELSTSAIAAVTTHNAAAWFRNCGYGVQ